VPIAKSKKKGSNQLQFDTEWTKDRIEENKLVNDVRRPIGMWRKGGYFGMTPTTARLLSCWIDFSREKELFFCQIGLLLSGGRFLLDSTQTNVMRITDGKTQ
jgi:type III restriction enzyme